MAVTVSPVTNQLLVASASEEERQSRTPRYGTLGRRLAKFTGAWPSGSGPNRQSWSTLMRAEDKEHLEVRVVWQVPAGPPAVRPGHECVFSLLGAHGSGCGLVIRRGGRGCRRRQRRAGGRISGSGQAR